MALENTTWRLVGLLGRDATDLSSLATSPITLAFIVNTEGALTIAGTGGCNRYISTYTAAGGALTIAPIASTRMMGPPEVMILEGRYLLALSAATRYAEYGDDLVIIYPGGELRFTRATR